MKSFLPLILLLISISSYAAVYMQTDNNDVTYSDTPVENSQKIDPNNYNNAVMPSSSQDTSASTSSAPAPQSEPAPTNIAPPITDSTITPPPSTPAPGAPTTISGEKKEKKPYTLIAITSPADQETIPNQPTIPVTVKTEPDLQQGDKIQLYIDSSPIGDALPSTSLMLPFIERGTHTLSAAIIDKDNKVLKQTDNITIYVQRVNLNTPRSSS